MVKRRKRLNLDVLRFFFDPHPGFAGAAIPIPAEVKKVADALNGTKTSLRKAVKRIRAVTSGEIWALDGWIHLIIKEPDGTRHGFCVIRFR